MFTGLVQALGRVERRTAAGLSIRARIRTPRAGASIAVNGCCLTVVRTRNGVHGFDVGPETWARTNLGDLRVGRPVNVEPALRIGDEVGGHFVAGHVDATAEILSLEPWEGCRRLRVALPRALARFTVEKGSIAVDGVSLTVTAVSPSAFEVMLVAHTLARTTLGRCRAGERVNLEADPLARYAAAGGRR